MIIIIIIIIIIMMINIFKNIKIQGNSECFVTRRVGTKPKEVSESRNKKKIKN